MKTIKFWDPWNLRVLGKHTASPADNRPIQYVLNIFWKEKKLTNAFVLDCVELHQKKALRFAFVTSDSVSAVLVDVAVVEILLALVEVWWNADKETWTTKQRKHSIKRKQKEYTNYTNEAGKIGKQFQTNGRIRIHKVDCKIHIWIKRKKQSQGKAKVTELICIISLTDLNVGFFIIIYEIKLIWNFILESGNVVHQISSHLYIESHKCKSKSRKYLLDIPNRSNYFWDPC